MSTDRDKSGAWAWAVAAVLIFGLLMFIGLTGPGRILFTSDNNIGQTAMVQRMLPGGLRGGGWWDGELLGQPMMLNANLTHLLIWALPLEFAHNWIRGIQLGLASLLFLLFLREHRRSWPAALLGTIVAFWLGQFTIFTYGGHLGKCGALVFASGFLWATAVAARRRSLAWGALAGAFLGGAFAEQPDIGLIFAIGLGLYPLHAWARKHGFEWRRLAAFHLVLFGVAFLLALVPLLRGYDAAIRESDVIRSPDREAKWNYITQWSLPPEDLVDLVAPGYHGIRTGEPEGPYWGRIGRTAGWERTGEGFRNFRLDHPYVGILPFVFALFAFVPAVRARIRAGRSGPATGTDRVECHVLFFSLMSLLMLGFALGKFSPLYGLLYRLPVISDVRAPVKFLGVFQLTLGVVAAYGLDLVFRGLPGYWDERARDRMRWFPWFWGGVALAFAAAAGAVAFRQEAQLPRWIADWGSEDLARIIEYHRITALLAAAVFAAAGAAMVAVALRRAAAGRSARALAWLVVAAAAGDAWFTSRPFVHTFPRSQLVENAALRAMNDRESLGRVGLLTQEGFYNHWLSVQFPYHALRSINITQMPRIAEDYRRFLDAVAPRMIRFWDLAAVTRLAGPADWLDEIARQPGMGDRMRPLLRYQVAGTRDGGIAIRENPVGGEHAVWAFHPAMPRFFIARQWEAVPEPEMPARLAADDFVPGALVLVRPEDLALLGDAVSGSSPEGPEGMDRVRIVEYRSGYAKLEVVAAGPALLRFAEKIHPLWKASVDGRPVPVLRIDAVCIGVPVPEGRHDIILDAY